jgi:hypothetical protein
MLRCSSAAIAAGDTSRGKACRATVSTSRRRGVVTVTRRPR